MNLIFRWLGFVYPEAELLIDSDEYFCLVLLPDNPLPIRVKVDEAIMSRPEDIKRLLRRTAIPLNAKSATLVSISSAGVSWESNSHSV